MRSNVGEDEMRLITRPYRARLFGLAAALGLLLAGYTPAMALGCGTDSGGMRESLYCGDNTCQVHMCGPSHMRYPQAFPPGSACPGRRIGAWGMAGDGQTYMTVCVALSVPHIGCHWKAGPPNNHRYSGDMSEVCAEGPRVKMPSWSTQAPSSPPRLSPQQRVANGISGLIADFPGSRTDRMKEMLTRDLNGVIRKSMGEKPSAEAGRFVSRLMGVGACNRHFYNNSGGWWGIAMWYAGTCEGEAVPNSPMGKNHYACMIAPHTSIILHYANYGDEPDGGRIAITNGQFYNKIFNLREVGCYIKHNGNTGAATLNDPADGDVAVVHDPNGGSD
jgi:hypothetical protein